MISLSSSSATGSYSDILGIANFEWEEKFKDSEIRNISNFLANKIQNENYFDINFFVSCVLPNCIFSYNK